MTLSRILLGLSKGNEGVRAKSTFSIGMSLISRTWTSFVSSWCCSSFSSLLLLVPLSSRLSTFVLVLVDDRDPSVASIQQDRGVNDGFIIILKKIELLRWWKACGRRWRHMHHSSSCCCHYQRMVDRRRSLHLDNCKDGGWYRNLASSSPVLPILLTDNDRTSIYRTTMWLQRKRIINNGWSDAAETEVVNLKTTSFVVRWTPCLVTTTWYYSSTA